MNSAAHDFTGGVAIAEHKAHRLEPARTAPLPPTLTLSLVHRGVRLRSLIDVAVHVMGGELLAKGPTKLHAPTSGTVRRIDGDRLRLDVDGADVHVAPLPPLDVGSHPDVLLERIEACGVIGLGGGGFSSAEKFARARHAGTRTLIINAVECEPGVTADETLMRAHAGEVVEGATAIASLIGAQRTLVAIDPRNSAMPMLERALGAEPRIELLRVPPRYPAGSERQLASIATGDPLPPGTRPHDRGLLIVNVATAHAVHSAIAHGRPMTRRLISITGSAVAAPGTVWTPIGYDIDALLSWWGADAARSRRVGGPVTGVPILDAAYVDKTTYAVAVLGPAANADPCIRCGQCNTACPEVLAVDALHAAVTASASTGRTAALERLRLRDCIECGACELVCPSRLPLLAEFRAARTDLRRRDAEEERARRAASRFERQTRRKAREASAAERAHIARKLKTRRPWLEGEA